MDHIENYRVGESTIFDMMQLSWKVVLYLSQRESTIAIPSQVDASLNKTDPSQETMTNFTEAKAEVKYRASTRIRGPKHDTRFEWPVSILIMTRHPSLSFKTHKTSAKNPRLLTITGAIWFCRYRQCTPSQLWMHPPVAKERRLMTSQYPIFDRTDIWILSECKLSTDNFVNY